MSPAAATAYRALALEFARLAPDDARRRSEEFLDLMRRRRSLDEVAVIV